MGTLDISEYIDTNHGNLIEPPVAHQTIEIDGEARLSAPLHKLTRCIRIVSDVDCLIGIAVGESKPAQVLTRGKPETRIIQPGEGFLVSVVGGGNNQGGGADFATALIALIADPKASKERLAELRALEATTKADLAKLRKGQQDLGQKQAMHDKAAAELAKQSADYSEFVAMHDGDLKTREETLAKTQGEFEQLTEDRMKSLDRREKDVGAREDALAHRAQGLREAEKAMETARADLDRRLAAFKIAMG